MHGVCVPLFYTIMMPHNYGNSWTYRAQQSDIRYRLRFYKRHGICEYKAHEYENHINWLQLWHVTWHGWFWWCTHPQRHSVPHSNDCMRTVSHAMLIWYRIKRWRRRWDTPSTLSPAYSCYWLHFRAYVASLQHIVMHAPRPQSKCRLADPGKHSPTLGPICQIRNWIWTRCALSLFLLCPCCWSPSWVMAYDDVADVVGGMTVDLQETVLHLQVHFHTSLMCVMKQWISAPWSHHIISYVCPRGCHIYIPPSRAAVS